MRKALDWVKENKKIIIVAALIVVLVCILFFMNKGAESSAAGTFSSREKSVTEQKLTSILSNMEGVGDTEVMINESDGVISGVVIVCRGADNIMTRNDILNAVSTALNIDKKIIAIYSMN